MKMIQTTLHYTTRIGVSVSFKLHTYLAHCNCVKFRPDQMLGSTGPLYRPCWDQAFANMKQSFVVSAQYAL